MLAQILLAPLITLAAPPVPAAFECDRLVAAGAFTDAERPCAAADAPGNLEALTRARTGDLADRQGPAGLAATTTALAEAARARRAAPDRVIEEALFQHLARVLRALAPPESRPDAAQWPLAGLPVPAPTLPRIEDERLDELDGAMARSDERIREVEARLAGVDPRFGALPPAARDSLATALGRLRDERARLVDKRLAILEERTGGKRPAPTDLLHLADTYFAIDRALPTTAGQRKRGLAELRRIRRWYPADGAAGIAALWLAGFALDEGEPDRARPLLDEAGPFDPALSTFFESLLDWRRGDANNALERLASIAGPLPPALTAQVEALRGLIHHESGDPRAAAAAWQRAAENAPAAQARRARHNAAIAWSAALAADPATARQIPQDLRRDAWLHTLSRGRLDDARALFDAIEATGRPADLPHLGLMLVDARRAAGDAAAADRLLGRLIELCVDDGAWRTTHAGDTAETARRRLLARVERRVAQLIDTNLPLAPAARATIDRVVTARLQHFDLTDADRLALAAPLGRLGFLEAVEPHLTRLAADAIDPILRRDAAAAHLTALIQRAREAGATGAPTGPWLGGPPLTAPIPDIVTRVLDAHSRVVGYLPLGSAERDELIVDRATIRIGTGDTDGIYAELQGVLARHPDTALGLRALYQMMRARPDRAERLAADNARTGAGPAARNRALQSIWQAAYPDPARDPARDAMQAGRYLDAAATYDAAATRPGQDPAPARLAAAVAWTWSLRPDRAEAAWRRFVDQHPTHPQAQGAWLMLARLLQTQGRLPDAAAAYQSAAARPGPDAPRALLRAARLQSGDFTALRDTLTRFLQNHPKHPEAARLTEALAALRGAHAPPAPPAPPHSPRSPPPPARPTPARPPASGPRSADAAHAIDGIEGIDGRPPRSMTAAQADCLPSAAACPGARDAASLDEAAIRFRNASMTPGR
ncbi:MAG: tetratricopeptide repeat protein [Myxococcales bacterium]|nr:tetratricopeptide repeat protein [Myxococcales bacterium]